MTKANGNSRHLGEALQHQEEVIVKRICVFCGSLVGKGPRHAEQAKQLGEALVRHGLGLVFGGGHVGLMGVLADAVLKNGGEAIGVIPQALVDRELAHSGLTKLHVLNSMHERKALMADLSDGFIGLSGGYGTADELFEILTWAQLGIHQKPIGLLNVNGFFDPLLAWLDHAVEAGFVRPVHRRLLLVDADADALVRSLLTQPRIELPPKVTKEDR